MEPIELIYSLSNGIMFHHLRIGWVFFWVRSPRAMLTKKKNLAGTYVYSRSYVFPLFFSRTRPLHRETFIGGIFIYIYVIYIRMHVNQSCLESFYSSVVVVRSLLSLIIETVVRHFGRMKGKMRGARQQHRPCIQILPYS